MDKSFCVNTHIHKTAKIGDVGDDTRKNHAFTHVFECFHGIAKRKSLELLTWVASWLVEFLHDVLQRWHTHFGCNVMLQIHFCTSFLAFHQLCHRAMLVLCHLFHDVVGFWMHGRVVERLVSTADTQKSRTLFKCFLSHAWHLEQLLAVLECSILSAVVHDVLSKERTKSTDIGEEMLGCRVNIHTHFVHATHHGLVERFLQFRLVHILLILSYTDGTWVNLHEFGKRVHQSSSNTHGTAYRHVVVREFLACHLRCGIDGSTVFAHHKHLDALWQSQSTDEILCLATCRTVTNRNGFRLVLFGECPNLVGCRFSSVWSSRVGEDGFVMKQIAFGIQTNHLASCAETWVDTHHSLLPKRCRHQQLFQVAYEDADSLLIGNFFR